MTIPKLYPDVEQVLKYPDSLGNGGTTQHEFQEFIRNIYGVLAGCVKSGGVWQSETTVSAGDVITAPAMPLGVKALVTKTGVTGTLEPTWGEAGTSLTDGTAEYAIIPSYVLVATNEETSTGTDTKKAVSPAGLHTELIKYTNKAISKTYYRRTALPTPAKTKITIAPTTVRISNVVYQLETAMTLNLAKAEAWDNVNYVANMSRAGKDFYIYACIPDRGTEPKFILSANSTVPTGYTADNSRKIGGFHCLCASVGTISGHSLSGYITGDILPASVWDLLHRCKGENEGMAYDAYDDVWIGIYLLSYDNGRAVSRFNGVILDGESTPKTHGLWFTETLAKQKMRLPYLHEFFNALKGCQEQVNISGSKDWNTTGGHVYTNNVRCISNIGLEDPTGFMWQWSNNYGMAGGSEWGSSTYDSQVDSVNRGGTYGNLWLPLCGGRWDDGSNCGSRSVDGSDVANMCRSTLGARPVSEPRVVIF